MGEFLCDYRQSDDLGMIIVEPVNKPTQDGGRQLAYDMDDVTRRLELTGLTQEERRQLVEHDEWAQLVAHLSELVSLKAYPYSQTLMETKLASAITLKGEERGKITVVRHITDLLEARVDKFPEDDRGRMTLALFTDIIEPTLQALPSGGEIIFFSPPNRQSNFENAYGFVYSYSKKDRGKNAQINCVSVMLDWEDDDYRMALEKAEADLRAGVSMLPSGQALIFHTPDALTKVISSSGRSHLWGKKVDAQGEWLKHYLEDYAELEAYIVHLPETQKFLKALTDGDSEIASEYLRRLQIRILHQFQPEVLEQAKMVEGQLAISLACGWLFLGGRGGLEMAIMGINNENDWYICDACGYAHRINARVNDLVDYCHGCGKEVEKCS